MTPFRYVRADDAAAAVALTSADPDASYLGGGSNLIDHLKLGITHPRVLVDVTGLGLDQVDQTDDGVRIGTNVRNSDLAAHPALRAGWPAVSRALLAGASGQIRHQATTGGNLLQRTRCVYFQDPSTPCNKREPGSGCSAVGGYGRYNAVLGASDQCVATHPSDLAVALVAVDAVVVVLGRDGERRLPIGDLHRLPGDHPEQDSTLAHGELITHVELSSSALAGRSTYYKVRDRASYAFALVSVAAGLEQDDDGTIRDIRLAWGGMAHRPWRASLAEDALRGGPLTEGAVRDAVDLELSAAVTDEQSAYKVPMVRAATAYTLHQLVEGHR